MLGSLFIQIHIQDVLELSTYLWVKKSVRDCMRKIASIRGAWKLRFVRSVATAARSFF